MSNVWSNIISDAGSKISQIVSTCNTNFSTLKSSLASKLDEVKGALASKWEAIKNQATTSLSNMTTSISTALNNLPNTFSKALESARSSVSTGLNKISSLFSNASWSLPKIKVPKITVSGKFSLDPLTVPKFNISYYKRGGIIDGITPLGMTGSTMHIAGEPGAGKEMVVPLENTSFTTKIASAMGQAVDNALARSKSTYNSSYDTVEKKDIVLQIDGREFARTSINSINKLQRESGRTLLDI